PTPDAHSKDTGMRFSAAYKFGNHRVAGDIARLKYEESGQIAAPSKFVSYEHTNWAISFESSWGGPWRTAIEWVRAAVEIALQSGAPAVSGRQLAGARGAADRLQGGAARGARRSSGSAAARAPAS